MDFSLGEDRQLLVDSLGRYLAENYTFAQREAIIASPAGWSPETWGALAELGIVGALFGAEQGGFGGTPFDIGVVFGEIGKALVGEPFLPTLLAGRVLAAAGLTAPIEAAIAGSHILAFAHEEADGATDPAAITTTAQQSGDGWTISGTKAVIAFAAQADQILVTARTAGAPGDSDGVSTFLVDRDAPGLSIRDYALVSGGRAGEVTLADTPAQLVGEAGAAAPVIEAALAAGLTALAWEAVAIMDVLKAQTLDYLRTRKQFGVPIGKFQALQHRMATVALEIEQARSAAINAAAALDGDRLARERAASAAKVTIGRIGSLVAEEAIQLHGGIGMTWELPLSHYAKRLVMIGHQLGDEDHHLERYIALGKAEAVPA